MEKDTDTIESIIEDIESPAVLAIFIAVQQLDDDELLEYFMVIGRWAMVKLGQKHDSPIDL